MTEAMTEEKRSFLLEDWGGFVADQKADAADYGRVTPETARFVDHGERLIAWLEGGPRPGARTRKFLEERLDAYDQTHGYARIVFGHDALAAAIDDLR